MVTAMKDHVDHDDGLIHDFFLFRHCVRSTAATFDDILRADDPVGVSRTTSDTTKQNLPRHPDWNVPTNWCTETGLNITQAVGRFLMSERLLNNNNNKNDVHWHIQFIADAKAHRDVDTAWALAQGMREAVVDARKNTKSRVTVTGLDQIYTEEWLFSGCQEDEGLHVDKEQQLQAVLDRLETLPPPPDFPIQQALDTIAEFFSDEEFQHLNLTNAVVISNSTRNFVGSVDFIKTFAQMAFYSHASNVPFELYNNHNSDDVTLISRSTIYKLLQYVHWSRSITSVDVPFAAYVGAIHATTMLAALRDGTYYPLTPPPDIAQSSSKSDTTHQHRATILTGHDTDLDALATVLGGRWILRPPYLSGGDAGAYLPTPPLAALHARHHVRTGIVELQLLYPVYSSSSSTGANNSSSDEWVTNTTGVLEATAIIGTPFPVIGTSTEVPSLDALEEHMQTVLAHQYPGADRCYQAGLQFQQTMRQKQQPQPTVHLSPFPRLYEHNIYVSTILSVVLLGVMVVGGMWMWRRHRPKRRAGYDATTTLETTNAGAISQMELA